MSGSGPHRETWGDWRPSPTARRVGMLLLVAVLAFAVFGTVRGIRRSLRSERTRVSLQHVRAIGVAFENFPKPGGVYPCLQASSELPASVSAQLSEEVRLDGWDRRIITIASPERYVVMSLGSDGVADPAYQAHRFEDDAGDVIFSNGEWLHFPAGMVSLLELAPRVADALREAAACPATVNVPLCRHYSYFPSEAAAQAAASEITALGLTTEIRRAASGRDFLVVAGTDPENCQSAASPLTTIVYKHGGRAYG